MRKTSNPILAPTVIGFGSPVPFPSVLSLNGFIFYFIEIRCLRFVKGKFYKSFKKYSNFFIKEWSKIVFIFIIFEWKKIIFTF